MSETIKKWFCKRCKPGAKGWFPRKPGRPRICPYCKNPKYDESKEKK